MRMRFDTLATLVLAPFLILACVAGNAPSKEEQEKPEPAVSAKREVIDPASPLPDLADKDLKTLWRQEMVQFAGNKTLKKLYVLDRTLVVETLGANLLYLDAHKGLWEGASSLSYALAQPPVMCGNDLYAISRGNLLRIDPGTGKVLSETVTGLAASSPPLAYDQSIIMGTADSNLWAVNVETGLRSWRISTQGPVKSALIRDGVSVYAAASGGSVVCVAPRLSSKLWSWKPGGRREITTGIAQVGGALFVADNTGFLYALDPASGRVRFNHPMGRAIAHLAPIGKDKLLVLAQRGEAFLMNVAGEPKALWKFPDGKRFVTAGRKNVYLLCGDGSLAAVSLDKGELKWRFALAKQCSAKGGKQRGTFYLYSRSGSILALRERN